MNENNEPDWLAELAKGGEALRRQIKPIVQAAEQFVRDSRQAKTSGGPALPFAQRVALAVDAGIRELLPAREPVVHEVTLSTTVIGTASLTGVGTVTARGSIALPQMGIAAQGTVEDRRGWLTGMTDGQKTQAPTKDSMPRDVTRNCSNGIAFAVGDHVANDALLGQGAYAGGHRAPELIPGTDRGTALCKGFSGQRSEIIQVHFLSVAGDDDQVTPLIKRSLAEMARRGRAVPGQAGRGRSRGATCSRTWTRCSAPTG